MSLYYWAPLRLYAPPDGISEIRTHGRNGSDRVMSLDIIIGEVLQRNALGNDTIVSRGTPQ